MKCSDCKLWKTDECKNNLGVKNLDYAEAFACFVPTVEQEPISYVYTRRPAIVSLVCGILSIVLIPWIPWNLGFFFGIGLFLSPFLGLIGIVVGAIYLKATRKTPNRSGRVMAIIGIICGSISVIVFGFYLIMAIPIMITSGW